MKIYIDLLPCSTKLAGTGYYIKRILKYLQVFDKRNEYILLVSNLKNPDEVFNINNPNFKIVKNKRINSRLIRILYQQFILPLKIRSGIYLSPQMAVPLLLNPWRVKVITVIHDLIPFIIIDKYSFNRSLYIKLIAILSVKRANVVISVSKNTKKDIIEILKINEKKIKIIHNFLDFEDRITNYKQKSNNYFITVCTIQPGKNLIRMIKAFHKYLEYDNESNFYIIGQKGWKYEKIIQLVEDLNLKGKVLFLGYVNETDLMKYYNNAKALIYASLYEGFGLPPLEAMYYKCPVIISNNSSFPEVTGKAGIYVNPYSVNDIYKAMIGVDKGLYRDRLDFMKKEVSKFSGKKEVRKLLNIIEIYK